MNLESGNYPALVVHPLPHDQWRNLIQCLPDIISEKERLHTTIKNLFFFVSSLPLSDYKEVVKDFPFILIQDGDGVVVLCDEMSKELVPGDVKKRTWDGIGTIQKQRALYRWRSAFLRDVGIMIKDGHMVPMNARHPISQNQRTKYQFPQNYCNLRKSFSARGINNERNNQ